MKKNNLIKFQNVTKTYKLSHLVTRTFFQSMIHLFTNDRKIEKFKALEDISFSIGSGEIIGIIGKNGSGKTTLLKLIAKIIQPISGDIIVVGKVVPFLDMGIGFHDDLTARENIMLYGLIMGIPKQKLKKQLNKILSFAGVKKFADVQLKKFSSGMNSRLAFATMIQTRGDIYLLDEIFAVGDKNFKPKGILAFEKMRDEGKTILLASHDLNIIRNYCHRVILLDKGKIILIGDPKKVVDFYEKEF